MNNVLNPSRQALNQIQASGADFVLQNRELLIGTTGNYSPSIDYLLTKSIKYQRSQVYEPNRFVVTGVLPSAAGSYLTIKILDLSHVGDAQGARATTIEVVRQSTSDTLAAMLTRAAALITQLITSGQLPDATVVADSTTLTISGDLINVVAVESCSVAQTNRTVALNGTPGTAIAGTTNVTVTTLAAHGLATGQLVNITGATGFVFTNVDNNNAVTSGTIQCTITVVTDTTFTLRGVTGAGTNSGTAVLSIVPSQPIGQGEELATLRDYVSPTIIAEAGKTYTTVLIEYANAVQPLNTIDRNQVGTHFVYLNEADTDITAALAKVREIQNAYTSGGTDSNPEAISVG